MQVFEGVGHPIGCPTPRSFVVCKILSLKKALNSYFVQGLFGNNL